VRVSHHHASHDIGQPAGFAVQAGGAGFEQGSITLSVSGQPGVDYWDYLRNVDAILRRYKARPHWGKMHFLDTDDVTALYPRTGDFRALRRKLDPKGRFLNDHVRMLLG
jgi:FAD/FMN-containing dehydrogenase